ncbi:hypothetical protein GCM10023116_19430 [Kistimonas scapharcae]|uniref:Ankyrin n=1 Tax=Kistimonas scapharcae TaxID=1036133 RepID=A0ABP8V0P6_9GAMM
MLKKIGGGFVLVFAKIATVLRSQYENDRRLAKAIKKFRDDPEELKAMIEAGVKLSRGYYYEGYEYPDYRMCPPLVRAMRDLENYNLDEVDRFKKLLDILIEGGASFYDTAYCNWEGLNYYQRRSPLGVAITPLIEEWGGNRSTTDAEKHKLGVVIKHLMEKGARYSRTEGVSDLQNWIHVLIMFGLSDVLKLFSAQGCNFYYQNLDLIFKSGDLESVKAILDGMLDRRHCRQDISQFMRNLVASDCDNEFKNKVLDIVVGLLNRKNQLDYVFVQELFDLAVQQGFVCGAERLLSLCPGAIQLERDYIIDVMKRNRARVPVESFNFMLKKGCDINCQDESGNTPLHLAAKESDVELLVFLLRNKACVDCLNHNGNTPFHLVSESMRKNLDEPGLGLDISYIKKKRKQSREMMEALVREGADLNVKNNEGYT